jgi:hypothetical protein
LLFCFYAVAQSKVPNHTLFFEKIYNLTETTGAVQSFVIAFNMFGMENTRMVSVCFTAGWCAGSCAHHGGIVCYAGRHQHLLQAAEVLLPA